MLAPIFAIFIIFSIVFFIFYKVQFFRSNQEMEKRWLSSKSRMALGFFLFFFGVNQLLMWDTKVTIIVNSIFVLYGLFIIILAYKAYRHYLPLAIEEAEKKSINKE